MPTLGSSPDDESPEDEFSPDDTIYGFDFDLGDEVFDSGSPETDASPVSPGQDSTQSDSPGSDTPLSESAGSDTPELIDLADSGVMDTISLNESEEEAPISLADSNFDHELTLADSTGFDMVLDFDWNDMSGSGFRLFDTSETELLQRIVGEAFPLEDPIFDEEIPPKERFEKSVAFNREQLEKLQRDLESASEPKSQLEISQKIVEVSERITILEEKSGELLTLFDELQQ